MQYGCDSAHKGHKLQAGLSGIIGEAFREMCSEKTYTALQSRALQGKPTGGKCYGYADGEAETVRQIFSWYTQGHSAKWIAAQLNTLGVPSPGASWNRTQRRRRGWGLSAINGDRRRGIGILNNELYIGRDVWNRSRWIKVPDSGKRRQVQRPESEWIVKPDESKRIVPQELWDHVNDRQRRLDAVLVAKTVAGKRCAGGQGPRYLFSRLMRCAGGSSFMMKDKVSYACSGFVSGQTCDNSVRVQRSLLEDRLLTTIRERSLSDSSIKKFTARLRRRLMSCPVDANAARRTELKVQIDNIVVAIGQGMISSALRQLLQEAEAELAELPGPPPIFRVDDEMKRIPEAVARYRQMVSNLGDASIDVERAREAVRKLLGEITIVPKDDFLVARMGLVVAQPILASNRGSGGTLLRLEAEWVEVALR